VENTGNTTMKYLEIFKTDKYEDISLNQWLALTPPEMVKVSELKGCDASLRRLTDATGAPATG
jgi:oxalate decarboxylase/phosphoglucose isomerase-like protein (cupin superfamily)